MGTKRGNRAEDIPITPYVGYVEGGLERPCPFCGSKHIYVTPTAIYCNMCGCRVIPTRYNGDSISVKDVWNGVLLRKET